MPEHWDYLILTAANDQQAAGFELQIRERRELGLLPRVREILVIPDREGKRIGSGGSTLQCLRAVLDREGQLGGIRVLIVHAGGDSRRLPAYSTCGKIFTPLPGENDSAIGVTLFDRLVPQFLNLPAPEASECGQIVVASGDALIQFDPETVRLDGPGLTVLGAYASPHEASRHGVYVRPANGESRAVRLYLQKPSIEEQQTRGAIDSHGRAVLDIGVMSFDARTASVLMDAFADHERDVVAYGVDVYREVCCALGTDASLEHYLEAARRSGSRWPQELLRSLFQALHPILMNLEVAPKCSFLHFGSTKQLISSGLVLARQGGGLSPAETVLVANSAIRESGWIGGRDGWVEGCEISAPLTLAGSNVIIGVDVSDPVALPAGCSMDVTPGRGRDGSAVFFVRCYGTHDSFKDQRLLGRPIEEWIERLGVGERDVWTGESRTLWHARLFPGEACADGYRNWLWMFDPDRATIEQLRALAAADRYSCAEIAVRADLCAFQERRNKIRAEELARRVRELLANDSGFSSRDLDAALGRVPDRASFAVELLNIARYAGGQRGAYFTASRVLHSLGDAVSRLAQSREAAIDEIIPRLPDYVDSELRLWMESQSIAAGARTPVSEWSDRLKRAAMRLLGETIVGHVVKGRGRPQNVLLPDETVWGRAPARIEYAGGWTDTPPYTLEHGGDVLNSAVNLNGQPPIHCYCRVVREPYIRLASIDSGRTLIIRELADLLDYGRPEDSFALAKAALALSGFAPGRADWPDGFSLERILELFGGGIELTTLVGVPHGSGLGTSSILGAVILAVIRRLTGRPLNQREIFHDVLRLEQALTTGGGWQDQIGGVTGGSKITSTQPGLFPDPRIHFLPDDLVDPRRNGGLTLLYYTGLTRLAKNILQEVVARYLNRERGAMQTLKQEHDVARLAADAMSRKDPAAFGHYVNATFELHKQLSGMVSNETIEELLARVNPHVYGRRLPGAGSGGFLFMICKSGADAAAVREKLGRKPFNERSRFFEYEVNSAGLEVTTC
jgi:galactokinase/mevalonate kinase-like predicted kinase